MEEKRNEEQEALLTYNCTLVIIRLAHEISKYDNNILRKHGLTEPQLKLISYLWKKRDVSVNQKMIEQDLRVKGSSVTNVLQKLENQGLIERKFGAEDKRQKLVSLTEKGRASSSIFDERIQNIEKQLCCDMSEEEADQFYHSLCKALDNFEAFIEDSQK